jgi:hypothetical protein
MASVKVTLCSAPSVALALLFALRIHDDFTRHIVLSLTATKVLVMMPFGILLWLGSTVAFCVTVA